MESQQKNQQVQQQKLQKQACKENASIKTSITEEQIHKFNEEEFQKLLDDKPWDSE